MKSLTAALLLVALCIIHVQALIRVGHETKLLPADAGIGLVVPSPILRISSLEFKGVVSDLLFISALVFEGGTYNRKEQPRIKPDEWQWFYKILTVSTDLDPYFIDPYYFANAHLTWVGGMVRETNTLLEKGMQFRDWDWSLPFYAGFNCFYFLQDNTKAAEFLVTASQRPGPSEQLLSLASRLAYKQKNTENAILFLEAILRKTDDERLKKAYETRIRALQARLILERAFVAYEEKYGRAPLSLQHMKEKGIIASIPMDPYGGTFSINPNGGISSTSDYLLMPKQK